jgi:amidohydrolase
MTTIEMFQQQLPELTAWRHDFHAHPEIGFEEHRTSGIVAKLLEEWGIQVHRGLAGTGVVGVLRGLRPGNRAIGLRADMDALPMEEQADVPYKSTNAGAFHGCGHDGHTTILLGTARALAKNRDFAGTVHFIFQPGEETLYGSKRMIDGGLFDRFPCDEIYGLHNMPGLGVGKVCCLPGVMMASCDSMQIVVKGKGGHGAMPHLSKDPIAIAAQLIVALQMIVARSADPLDSGVLSVCMIHGGSAFNVIPDQVELSGTIRAISAAGRRLLHQRLREVCAGVAATHGADIECKLIEGCPATVNTPEQADAVLRAAERIVGPQNVTQSMKPLMASEDFSHMLENRKGAYFFVGQDGEFCHHPKYQFNDAIMPVGAAILSDLVRERLNEGAV